MFVITNEDITSEKLAEVMNTSEKSNEDIENLHEFYLHLDEELSKEPAKEQLALEMQAYVITVETAKLLGLPAGDSGYTFKNIFRRAFIMGIAAGFSCSEAIIRDMANERTALASKTSETSEAKE